MATYVTGSNVITNRGTGNTLHIIPGSLSTILSRDNVIQALSLFDPTSPCRIEIDSAFTEIGGTFFGQYQRVKDNITFATGPMWIGTPSESERILFGGDSVVSGPSVSEPSVSGGIPAVNPSRLPPTLDKSGTCFAGIQNVSEVIFIGDSQCKEIGEYCFNDCSQLTKVDMTSTKLTTIRKSTFIHVGFDAEELIVLLPSGLTTLNDWYNGKQHYVTTEPGGLWVNDTQITTAFRTELPGGLFMGSPVKHLVIPEGVVSIDLLVFQFMDKLETLILPSTLVLNAGLVGLNGVKSLRVPLSAFDILKKDFQYIGPDKQFIHFYESPYVQVRTTQGTFVDIDTLPPSSRILVPFQEDIDTNPLTKTGLDYILDTGNVPVFPEEEVARVAAAEEAARVAAAEEAARVAAAEEVARVATAEEAARVAAAEEAARERFTRGLIGLIGGILSIIILVGVIKSRQTKSAPKVVS
jgi:hypothetical protein